MNPLKIDESSVKVIDDLIRSTLNDMKKKQPARAQLVRYAVTHGLGEIDVVFEGTKKVITRLKYRNPRIKPIKLFTIACQLEKGNGSRQLWKVISMGGA